MPPNGIRVLGVDTSLRSTGLGVVEARGASLKGLHYEVIKNAQKLKHTECLLNLYEGIRVAIEAHRPDCVSIEGVFYCKNVRTAIVLGQARGAVLAACASSGLKVYEYAPRKVKQAVVGTGTAHKEQVAKMIKAILGLPSLPPPDAADALAIAVCHVNSRSRRLPDEDLDI